MLRLANRLLALGGIKLVSATEARPDMDADFLRLYARCQPYTMTSIERMFALYTAVRYVVTHTIPGAFVECGVWRGGSSMLVALTLQALGVTDRELYLYDTFAGMSAPTGHDVDYAGAQAAPKWSALQSPERNDWCLASLDEVQANMQRTGYPARCIHYVQGKVEETIPGTIPEGIALLRLDTDWYESTYHELVHLFPRLAGRGVLILDDYGHWQGARQATDQYFAETGTPMLLNRVDYTARIGVKVPG